MKGETEVAGRRIQVRKKNQNRVSMALVILVVLTLLVVVSYNGKELKEKREAYAEKEAELLEEIEAEEKRAVEIEEYGKYTQTKKYVEEVAKEKFGLVKENEIIFKEE